MGFFKTISEWTISDIASIIGGLIILVYACVEVFKKATEHTEWAKKRKTAKQEEKRESFRALYTEFTDSFVKDFVPPLVEKLEDSDKQIINQLEKLTTSSNDILRKEMTDIYYRYLPYKKILQYDKKCFVKLYNDYGAQGGNSYINEINNEISKWEVVLKEEDLFKQD